MNTCLLGDAIASRRSGFPSGKRSGDGVVQLRMNNVRTDGTLDLASVIRVPATKKQVSDLSLTKGDVLFNSTNSPELVGKTCLFKGFAEPIVFSNHFVRLRTRPERLRGDYLARWLTWTRDRGVFTHGCVRWVNQATFRTDDLFRLRLPLPPLAEQKRIAGILDAADALRAKRREALAQLDALLQSTFLDMFGDPVTNPKGWMVTCVGDVTQMGTGSTPSRNHKNYFGGSIPWVKSTEVDWGTVTATSECLSSDGVRAARLKLYPKGSIVLALYGQGKTRGKCAVLGIDATINQACCTLVPRDPNSTPYLFQFLKYSYHRLRGESRGGNQENLNMRIVRAFAVPVPPLDVQQRYATIAESVEKQKTRQRSHLAELDTLFASLQSRAFRGGL